VKRILLPLLVVALSGLTVAAADKPWPAAPEKLPDASNDTLYGGDGTGLGDSDGDDQIEGGDGQDTLYGENGDDTLIDRSGGYVDTLEGGAGEDTLDCYDNATANFDTVKGDGGDDTFYVDDSDNYPDWAGDPPEPFDVDTSGLNLSTTNKLGENP